MYYSNLNLVTTFIVTFHVYFICHGLLESPKESLEMAGAVLYLDHFLQFTFDNNHQIYMPVFPQMTIELSGPMLLELLTVRLIAGRNQRTVWSIRTSLSAFPSRP